MICKIPKIYFTTNRVSYHRKIDVNLNVQSTLQSRDDWVLCRIFLKKRSRKSTNDDEETLMKQIKGNKSSRKDKDDDNNVGLVFYDFMARDQDKPGDSNSGPASSSSVITELSIINAANDGEAISNLNGRNSFPCFRTQS